MRITVDMDLDYLAGAVGCADTIDTLREMFDDDAVESALDSVLDGSDIEDVEQTIKENIFTILSYIVPEDRPLTKEQASTLSEVFYQEVTVESLRDNGVPVECPLRDEHGEYELVPADDPRQMTLFDETGLPPPMKKRYITTEE